MAKKKLELVAMILLILGGLNWGLTVFNLNLVNIVLGSIPILEKVVYGLVGLSALYISYLKWVK